MKLEELQDILFDILCEVDNICTKNKINYYLMYGTLIGAVRHNGFIPWDDDVDIGVWRKDYTKMRKALKENLPSHLKLIEPSDLAPNFYDFACRVVDTRYMWHAEEDEDRFYSNLQNHVCVDIFFIDYSSPQNKMGPIFLLKQKVLYGLAMGHRYQLKWEKYSSLNKVMIWGLKTIGTRINIDTILRWQESLSRKYNQTHSQNCVITNVPLNYMHIHESHWFGTPVPGTFRNHTVPLPPGYDAFLTAVYGDYMKPPKDKAAYIQHYIES